MEQELSGQSEMKVLKPKPLTTLDIRQETDMKQKSDLAIKEDITWTVLFGDLTIS